MLLDPNFHILSFGYFSLIIAAPVIYNSDLSWISPTQILDTFLWHFKTCKFQYLVTLFHLQVRLQHFTYLRTVKLCQYQWH